MTSLEAVVGKDEEPFEICHAGRRRACWIWNDYSQLGAMRLVGYLSSHIQRALVE